MVGRRRCHFHNLERPPDSLDFDLAALRVRPPVINQVTVSANVTAWLVVPDVAVIVTE
jgi:hypothetical protein